MNNRKPRDNKKRLSFSGGVLFLIAVLVLYGILLFAAPEKAVSAILETGKIIRNILGPMFVVLVVMVCFNLFIHPGRIVRLVGTESGLRGMFLAAAAGIISMGPIYAWFPFLRELREKGAGAQPVAVFLGSRAIKPVLLPVMISYFGWIYTFMLTLFIFIGAFIQGSVMGVVQKD